MGKSYLLIGLPDSPHLHGLAINLKKKDPTIIVDILAVKKYKIKNECFDSYIEISFFYFWNKFIRKKQEIAYLISIFLWSTFNCKKYDVVEIHYLSLFHEKAIFFYKKVTNRVIAVAWGTDIFRLPKIYNNKLAKFLKKCTAVNLTTEAMYKKTAEILGDEIKTIKTTNCRFGLEFLNNIKQLRNKTPSKDNLAKLLQINNAVSNSVYTTLGYNGAIGQQHIEILDSLSNSNLGNTFLLIPMTYGANKRYHEKVINKLKQLKIPYKVFTKFMTSEEIAALRLITDIFIQLQITDALSGAMQEHMFSNNIIITGSWLPYDLLSLNDIYFCTVDNVVDIGDYYTKILENKKNEKKKFDNNYEKIWNLSSWDTCIEEWEKL